MHEGRDGSPKFVFDLMELSTALRTAAFQEGVRWARLMAEAIDDPSIWDPS